ncbi:MAG: VTT domain-containing protein [Deltaproteobacteria bacterium]|nr:VTT domain-containing protein [Deltaproteobacteria bacterium]
MSVEPEPKASLLRRLGVGRLSFGALLGAALVVIGLAANGIALVAPIDYAALGDFRYPGIFLLTFIANGSVVIPIPYIPVVIRVAEVAPNVPLVVLSAAAGSMLGESVAFFVGRAGKKIVDDSRVHAWLSRVVHSNWLSGLVLFALSAPLNPFFDVAGLAAGALGIPYKVFASAVLLGRIVRFGVVVWLGRGLLENGLPF